MMILAYVGESIVTTDRIGNAVIEYAKALVSRNTADVVDVPVALETGEAIARMLIGPTSQILALPTSSVDVTLHDDRALAELEAKLESIAPHSLLPTSTSPWDQFALLYDFL